MNNLENYFRYDPAAPLLFNSGAFLFFFILFLLLFSSLKHQPLLRKLWTIAFSLFFYYLSSGFYFWILLFSTVVDYALGFLIYNATTRVKKRFFLFLSLVSNLGLLTYFKYTNFFIETFNQFGASFSPTQIFLPVGISFYTFQTLSYSLDVYRGHLKPEKNFWNFTFFVTFFPQLVAGPIVRAMDFLPQLNKNLNLSRQDFGKAVFLIANGLFKKAVLSDYISVNFVDRIFETPALYNGFENLLGVYGYSLQIYCDFSGYSDMAIGIALLLGFQLPDNFRYPYKSASITEFWRRWHISLSSWLRDYLYISLGGNRKGRLRTYFNLMLTMLLGGLWHGASWKFVVWGGLHGMMLVIEKMITRYISIPKSWITQCLGIFITFHFVCFAWIFFRAENFSTAWEVIRQIATASNTLKLFPTIINYDTIVMVLVLGYVLHFSPTPWINTYKTTLTKAPLVLKALYISGIVWLTVQVATAEVIPFIYFQF